jgi:hypothetical protein
MKTKRTYDTTDNRSVLKKAYKSLLAQTEGICNFCPYHRGENADWRSRDKRNWKQYRRTRWKARE